MNAIVIHTVTGMANDEPALAEVFLCRGQGQPNEEGFLNGCMARSYRFD